MSDIHALSGAYAVDALDQFERIAFERHLAHCAHCTSEVDGLREASAFFAEITPMTPPAGLRDRVLAEVATVRPMPPVLAALPTASLRRRRPQPGRWTAGLVAAAAVVAALGVGAAVTQPWKQGTDTVQSATGSPVADAVLAAPDAEEIHSSLHGGKVVLVRSRELNTSVIVATGMDNPPSGKVFELWYQDSKKGLLPAGLMPVGGDGTVVLSGDARNALAVGVTIEPAQGSTVPTAPAEFLKFEQA